MKLDWSKGLIAVMALFIIFIVSMGIRMATSSQELYEQDYYEKGEQHTERMEMEENGKDIKIEYNHVNNSLDVSLDGEAQILSYKLTFLPDQTRDIYRELENSTVKDSFGIALNDNTSGIWVIELKGKRAGKYFFKKQQFVK